MFTTLKNFFSAIPLSRSSLSLIGLFVVLAAIPLTVFIAQQQQELRQMAAETNPTCTLSLQGGIDKGTVPFSTAVSAQIGPVTAAQIKSYEWNFGDGTAKPHGDITADLIGLGPALYQSHTYLQAGTYQIMASYKGTPTNPDFSCSKTVTVTATTVPPGIPQGTDTSIVPPPPPAIEKPPAAVPAAPSTSLTISTKPASEITANSAKLNATLNGLGEATSANVYFQWWDATTINNPNQSSRLTANAPGNYSINLSGLTPGTSYSVKAVAEIQGVKVGNVSGQKSYAYGEVQTLQTLTTSGAGTDAQAPPQNSVPTAGATSLAFSFKLQGVTSPQKTHPVKVEVFNVTSTTPIKSGNDISTTFSPGVFTGTFNLGDFTPGAYIVKLTAGNTLRKQIVTNIATGQNTLGEVELISGDLIQNNELDAADFLALVGCLSYTQGTTSSNCPDRNSADLNDDGVVDGRDLSILQINFSHRKGD